MILKIRLNNVSVPLPLLSSAVITDRSFVVCLLFMAISNATEDQIKKQLLCVINGFSEPFLRSPLHDPDSCSISTHYCFGVPT